MSRIFDPENKFWSAIGKGADVTCMSFLWTITSLPLVAVGAATTAFYAYTMRKVRDTEGGILSGFFSAFRQHFKKRHCCGCWKQLASHFCSRSQNFCATPSGWSDAARRTAMRDGRF